MTELIWPVEKKKNTKERKQKKKRYKKQKHKSELVMLYDGN